MTKPFELPELLERIRPVVERTRCREVARRPLREDERAFGILGASPAVTKLRGRIADLAASEATVVIHGESGTGKELVARAIHELGARASGPFVPVNCAAFPETLIEAELFGHERGAFTGACQKREGRFQTGRGGTLLLDEVGEIPLSVQVKLLRVVQERVVEPLGSSHPVDIDVRLLCATHRNLRDLVARGEFREDLYYRLNVLDVRVPPLRERRGDIPLLVGEFYRRFSGGAEPPELTPRAWSTLMSHPYPGNVRELEHAIQRAVVLARGGSIDRCHLPSHMGGDATDDEDAASDSQRLAPSLKDFERQCLLHALRRTQGKKAEAARLLGITRKTLWEKLKAHEIEVNGMFERCG